MLDDRVRMSTTRTQSMLPGTIQPESARAPYPYERLQTQPIYGSQPYGYPQRSTIELPRPLEPRPVLQTSLSEASVSQRHSQDAFRGPPALSDYRSQGPSLPGLKDIFSPSSRASPHNSYTAPWSHNLVHPATHGSEPYCPPSGWHPPLALHPSTEIPSSYPVGRRVELPVLESSPVARHPPSSLSGSPYAGYPEGRDYGDARTDRVRQASTASYPVNGASSPYGSTLEESQYRNNGPNPHRTGDHPLAGSSADPQRKYLGVRDVPGDGAYHVYEGGYRIPTQVDGECVNPAWGLTKANKPRKRLALACLDCREKKIKCEPGANSCLQCEKAKRNCRKAPLQQTPGESTPPAWPHNLTSPVRKGISDPTPHPSRENEADTANKRRSRDDQSPPNVPSKKHRSASPILTTQTVTARPTGGGAEPVAVQIPGPADTPNKMLAWEEDPIIVDRDTTLHLLDLYLDHVNEAAYCLYPRATLRHWATNFTAKCQLERMTLYAILAVGSVFADDRFSSFGRMCAQIAKDAIASKVGTFNLAVVHTRLLMAMYNTARGADHMAWDYTGSAIRACCGRALQFNSEAGCGDTTESEKQARIEFGLSKTQLVECRRRTFWSCFIMDRFEYGRQCAIPQDDALVRLPCAYEAYERGLPSTAPYLSNGIIDPIQTLLTPASPICAMAWLCLLSAIWGDVFNFSHRMIHRGPTTFANVYEEIYADTHNRLQGLHSRLPEYLQHTDGNVSRSIREGYSASFILVHALHHHLLIRLNRYTQHQYIDQERIKRNIRAAQYHSHALLGLFDQYRTARRQMHAASEALDPALSAPFVSNMILSAIDVAGAGGPDSTLGRTLELMSSGLECLQESARCWNAAKSRFNESQRRFYGIQNILTRPFKAGGGAWLGREWGMKDKLEQEFGWEHDCIYPTAIDGGTNDGYSRMYFEAFREDGHHTKTPPSGSVCIV